MGLFDAGKVSNNKGKIKIYDFGKAFSNIGGRFTRARSAGAGLGTSFVNALTPDRVRIAAARDIRTQYGADPSELPRDISGGYLMAGTTSPSTTDTTNYNLSDTLSLTGDTGTSTGGTTFSPTYFQGQLYTDPTSYYNAVGTYQRGEVDRAYISGMISLDERDRLISQNEQSLLRAFQNNVGALTSARDESLSGIGGYFSRISPDAYQSQEQTYRGKTEEEFGRGIASAEEQKSLGLENIAADRRESTRARSELEARKATDLQEIEDFILNNIQSFSNQTQGFGGAGSLQSGGTINTNETLNNLASMALQLEQFGNSQEEIDNILRFNIAKLGVDPEQTEGILAALYGDRLPRLRTAQGL